MLITLEQLKESLLKLKTKFTNDLTEVKTDLTSHTDSKDNPHNITLEQLGVQSSASELNYVKGVTEGIQSQLNEKANASAFNSHIIKNNNPHNVTLAQLGVNAGADKVNNAANNFEELSNSVNDIINGDMGTEIYIGSGDMPEGYKVQIDPTGEATVIGSVKDVTVNGTSIVTDGVANIQHNVVQNYFDEERTPSTYTVANAWTNIEVRNGFLNTRVTQNKHIDNRGKEADKACLNAETLDYAVKQAMCDGKGAEWTQEEKASARNRMGLDREPAVIEIEVTEEIRRLEVTNYNGLPLEDYDFKQMWIIAESVGGLTTTNNEVQIRINDSTTAGDTVYLSIPTNFTHNASKLYWGGMMDIRNGLAFSGNTGMSMAKWRSNVQASINMSDLLFQENIKGIYLYAIMANFPVGTKFKFILR